MTFCHKRSEVYSVAIGVIVEVSNMKVGLYF